MLLRGKKQKTSTNYVQGLRQCEDNICAINWSLRGGVSRRVVGVRRGSGSGAESNILSPLDLIDGGHALQRGIHFFFPQHFARARIDGANLAVASACKDQA